MLPSSCQKTKKPLNVPLGQNGQKVTAFRSKLILWRQHFLKLIGNVSIFDNFVAENDIITYNILKYAN